MSDTGHTIVCLSSQEWDDGMWTNKQHVMSRLARDHRVIHVDWGMRPLVQYLFRRIKRSPSDLLSPWKMLTEGVYPRDGDLYMGDAWAPVFANLFPFDNRFRDFWAFDFKVRMVRRWLDARDEDPIVWVYHPGYAEAVELLDPKLLVYDCVDNYEAFPKYQDDADWIAGREEALARKADLVFTSAANLVDKLKPYNPDHTHLVHNVGDARHFKQALEPETEVPDDLTEIAERGPVMGFVGAVSDYKLNVEWVTDAAAARPAWQFVIIGPVGLADSSTDVRALKRADNIYLMGHRDYEALPGYLKGFDVGLIPYNINEYTRSCFPIKFFEYLAAGLPVAMSNLPALEEFYGPVHVAEETTGFIEACEAALDQNGDGLDERVALAEENSWESKVAEMMRYVDDRLAASDQSGRDSGEA
jgi:glycosyltransferase involved in cell wall biosynthesis